MRVTERELVGMPPSPLFLPSVFHASCRTWQDFVVGRSRRYRIHTDRLRLSALPFATRVSLLLPFADSARSSRAISPSDLSSAFLFYVCTVHTPACPYPWTLQNTPSANVHITYVRHAKEYLSLLIFPFRHVSGALPPELSYISGRHQPSLFPKWKFGFCV